MANCERHSIPSPGRAHSSFWCAVCTFPYPCCVFNDAVCCTVVAFYVLLVCCCLAPQDPNNLNANLLSDFDHVKKGLSTEEEGENAPMP